VVQTAGLISGPSPQMGGMMVRGEHHGNTLVDNGAEHTWSRDWRLTMVRHFAMLGYRVWKTVFFSGTVLCYLGRTWKCGSKYKVWRLGISEYGWLDWLNF
jgi:hypothetical protein